MLSKLFCTKLKIEFLFLKNVSIIVNIHVLLHTLISNLQVGFLLLIAFSLVARTYCDVWMISKTTNIERSVVFQHNHGVLICIEFSYKLVPCLIVVCW